MPLRPSQNALDRMGKAIERAKRSGNVRFPRQFVRDQISAEPTPPLARIAQKGGEARLQVFLTVLMLSTRAPHKTTISASELAELLDFQAPASAGARRVTTAIRALEKLDLLKRHVSPGRVPTLEVLDPAGSGKAWDVNSKELSGNYAGIPIDLWKNGWITALTGRQLAMLIVLRELTNARKPEPGVQGIWVDGTRKRQYGFSDDTWTRATHELRDLGFLEISENVFKSFGEPRRRNLYDLNIGRLAELPPEN